MICIRAAMWFCMPTGLTLGSLNVRSWSDKLW
jgi:hypothetical protein